MSTDPTVILETTAATEAALDIESIKELMDSFDPASLLPELGDIFSLVTTVCQIAVMVGPIILLVLGIVYLLLSPREANHYLGYRCYYGMGSVEAWRFTQRFAGLIWAVLGLVLTVVMLILTGTFPGKPIMEIIGSGAKCLLWEAGLILVSILAINTVVMLCYDRKGMRRRNYD